ncbi:MAG: response regulator transcription factor [Oscillospiraceae bacterium]
MFNILIVDDDKNTQQSLSNILKMNGYKTLSACDGKAAFGLLCHKQADFVISELCLPDMGDAEFVKSMRLSGMEIPVIVVSKNCSIENKRRAFKSGADDFLAKPVDGEELVLRIKAISRRYKLPNEYIVTVGGTTLDYKKLSVSNSEKSVVLPKKEFYLLFKLLCSTGQIFTRGQIMDEIWGMDAETDARTVDVHVRRLRKKLADFDDFLIVSARGVGYKAEKSTKK